MVRVLINGFWWAFLADGAASVLRDFGIGGPLTPGLHAISLLTLLMSFPMAMVAIANPRVPKRVVGPMIVFLWWGGPGMAFPLALVDASAVSPWIAIAQVVIAGAVWFTFRSPGEPWASPFVERTGRAFSWPRVFATAAVTGCVFFVAAMMMAVSTAAVGISSLTGGYVRLRPDGLYLLERRFVSDGREVRLAGMIHIARKEFYADVLPEADPEMPCVVLVEGVTDRANLLGNSRLSYARMATLLGVSAQEDSEFSEHVHEALHEGGEAAANHLPVLDFKHADVDLETFHPKTVTFLTTVVAIFEAESLDQAIRIVSDPESPLNDEGAPDLVMHDILRTRNDHLETEIEASLKDYRRVVVPWGALHLAEIETWLRERRFEQQGQVERKALAFW